MSRITDSHSMKMLFSKLPLSSARIGAMGFLLSAPFRPRRETSPGEVRVYVRRAGDVCDMRYAGVRAQYD